jgi:hypothetical protein
MRNLARRPLALALSLLLLSVLCAYGVGLTQMNGHASRGTTPLNLARTVLRHLCAPHSTACAQASSDLMSATLLVSLVRPRADLAALAGTEADDAAANPATDAAPMVPAALLGLVAFALAFGWFIPATRRSVPYPLALALPTRSIPDHLCTPAP